jgi:predicted O-methyltransferase YrrM
MNGGSLEHEANNHRDQASVAVSGRDDWPVILELGTSLGISTLALALGAPHRKVISIEGCPELAATARDNLLRHGAHNAGVLCMEFREALALIRTRGTKVALAFIDGNHRGAALTEYVNIVREMGEEIIIVADDIHMNRDMIQAWQSLLAEKPAPASLETFRMGMLFCLRKLTPGHYRVR